MRLKALRGLGDKSPLLRDGMRMVVLEDNAGVPLAVACELVDGEVFISRATDEDFNRVLDRLGFNKFVIVDDVTNKLRPAEDLPKVL